MVYARTSHNKAVKVRRQTLGDIFAYFNKFLKYNIVFALHMCYNKMEDGLNENIYCVFCSVYFIYKL